MKLRRSIPLNDRTCAALCGLVLAVLTLGWYLAGCSGLGFAIAACLIVGALVRPWFYEPGGITVPPGVGTWISSDGGRTWKKKHVQARGEKDFRENPSDIQMAIDDGAGPVTTDELRQLLEDV